MPRKCPHCGGDLDAPTRFVKPTVEEIAAYCVERGNQVDAEAFWDFYQSKGWKVGAQAMKDWRAAVRTWEKRGGARPVNGAKYEGFLPLE